MSAPASYGIPKPGIIPALSIRAPWTVALNVQEADSVDTNLLTRLIREAKETTVR